GLAAAGAAVRTAAADTPWPAFPGPLPAEIVYVAADGAAAEPGLRGQDRLLTDGVMGLLELARALGGGDGTARRLTVVAPHVHHVTGREPRLTPAHSALFGLAKVIGQEHVEIGCRCVDVDEETAPEHLAAEILAADPFGQVALRGADRYVAELVPVDLTAADAEREPAGDEVHLITGGLGGLGLQVARDLSVRRPGARIALLGRRAVPPRETWDAVLAEGGEWAERIALLREMEERGTQVLCIRGDAADVDAMRRAADTVRAAFGRITCVVHAAGTAGDGFLLRKPAAVFRATLSPKVDGAAALDAATRADRPTMVLFSSTTALFGSAGQSDYTAANLYLDGFAAWRAKAGLPTVTVNWTDWIGTGMAADHGVQRDQGFFRSVEIEDGLTGHHAALRSGRTQVIVGEINYDMLAGLDTEVLRARMASAPIRLGEATRKTVADRASTAARAAAHPTAATVRLTGRPEGDYSELERTLGQLWGAEFGLAEVDVFAGLFDLGGDSLLALRLTNSVQKALGVRLTIADLFVHLTVADLAAHLAGADGDQDATGRPAKAAAVGGAEATAGSGEPEWFELWNAQQGMWLQHRLGEGRAELNLPVWHHVREPVDAAAFRRAVAFLVGRHEALRLVLADRAEGPRQRVLPVHDLDVPLIDLSADPDPEGTAERLIRAENALPFDDLGTPPVRVRLYRLADDHHAAHLTVHHIVADGTSMGILLRELLAAYRACAAGRTPELEPLPMGYREFVRDRQRWLAGAESERMASYWLGELAAPLPRLRVGDYDAPAGAVANRTLDFEVEAETVGLLGPLARRLDATLHVVLLSAYLVALHDIGSDEDIVLCVPFSGRDAKETEGMVGTFVNPLSVRVRLSGEDCFEDVVRRAQHKSVGSYANSRYPFARLLERLDPGDGRRGENPVFSAGFQFTDFLPPANQTSQLDFCLFGKPSGETVSLRLNYNSRRLAGSEVADIRATFLAVLRRVADDPAVRLDALAEPLQQARRAARTAAAPGGPGKLRAVRRALR
ncbi:SDR family NAD(P)-dependent oxidoreductase, partial [Kitasatospora sp. NPDC047058]|uniref:SDR family NAD(P)-dependent oxidoreductase n=1 Tax=Kitasatospora sp. NPDC047058 TaxID=3155620 RepID=UPI00340F45A6